MMQRTIKIAALVAAGGILLQASSCALILLQLFGQQIVTNALSSVIRSLLSGATGDTTGTDTQSP